MHYFVSFSLLKLKIKTIPYKMFIIWISVWTTATAQSTKHAPP